LIAKQPEQEFNERAAIIQISAKAAGGDSTRQRLQWIGNRS
jgi:hypothetical protein